MAFDGITIAAMVSELNKNLSGGRINKIAQPESDELLITGKGANGQKRLLLSASASLPLIYFTGKNRISPLTAPNFCMLLRKHIGSARITAIRQPGLERVVEFELEHLNELGDVCHKVLIMELMGKHSNIIFCDDNNMILDSIKHVSCNVSSVREVLPGRPYFIPHTQDKLDPLTISREDFMEKVCGRSNAVSKALYQTLTGFSPVMAQELCYRASIDGNDDVQTLDENTREQLYTEFTRLMEQIRREEFTPVIVFKGDEPVEYGVLPFSQYGEGFTTRTFESVSEMLETYYASRDVITRIRQKSSDLRRIVQTALERDIKKYDLQLAQMKDTKKREKYRIYGELLNTYGYSAKPGDKSLTAVNYYTNEPVTIPLDPTLSATENAKKYFDKYGKLKRTYEALSELTTQVKEEIDHLETISTALDIALKEEDLVEIKEELTQSGYIRRKGGTKKAKITSKPFHYLSSDGFHIYVGKNNFQNDELTFKFANGNDWWFHAKGIPGSHVVVKTEGKKLPDRTFEEAGRLAAYYSKGREQEKVEIDYVQKKQVKKPAGAKPGFVVYYTNYSLMIDSDISGIEKISD